jgi:hypothetical protein
MQVASVLLKRRLGVLTWISQADALARAPFTEEGLKSLPLQQDEPKCGDYRDY